MASLRKNVASQNVTFCLVTTAGAASTSTSTAIFTAFVTLDGTQAPAAGTFTLLGSGQWNYAPTQAETNAVDVGIYVTATTTAANCVPTNMDFHTDDFTIPADALLDRDMSTGTDSGSTTVRTPRQALRFLRNKFELSGSTLTVYKENDSTASWTSSVTASSAAFPVTANDPAGP